MNAVMLNVHVFHLENTLLLIKINKKCFMLFMADENMQRSTLAKLDILMLLNLTSKFLPCNDAPSYKSYRNYCTKNWPSG